jgi:hypothetical protein
MREELQTPEISGEPEAARIPELRDRRPKPEGVVPKEPGLCHRWTCRADFAGGDVFE